MFMRDTQNSNYRGGLQKHDAICASSHHLSKNKNVILTTESAKDCDLHDAPMYKQLTFLSTKPSTLLPSVVEFMAFKL